jgi:RNA polymerase sigma-B factor
MVTACITSREDNLFRFVAGGDPAARERLVVRYMPLARSLARRFFHTRAEREDLLQVASFGLLKAIDRFDPDRGVAFPTFATPTITGELKRYLRDFGFTIRVPRALHERTLAVERAVNALSAALGRSPTPGEVAERMSLSVEEVVEALEAAVSREPVSLDAPYADDEGPRGEHVGADDPRYAVVEGLACVDPGLRDLPDRQREILRLRFDEDLTQREIATRLGISQMHVSRLIRRSLDDVAAAVGAA